MALTRRQREVLDFISEFIEEQGYSPSLEEIGENFGLSSVATVHKHIQHLIDKGYLKKAWKRSRSIEPVEEESSSPALELPLLGSVAAGIPIEAVEVPERIEVPSHLVRKPGETYVLQVSGDSMIEDQICDGDYVIVESTATARDGETIVALVRGEEATLKKLYHKGPTVVLQPANHTMEAMQFPAEEVEVRGIVRGLMRSY